MIKLKEREISRLRFTNVILLAEGRKLCKFRVKWPPWSEFTEL